MCKSRKADSGTGKDKKAGTPSEKPRRRKVPRVQEAYRVRYELVDSHGQIIPEEVEGEVGKMDSSAIPSQTTPQLKSAVKCYIHVTDLPNHQEPTVPSRAEPMPAPDDDDLEIIEIPESEVQQKTLPDMDRLQTMLISLRRGAERKLPEDMRALKEIIENNASLIVNRLNQFFKDPLDLERQLHRVDYHKNIHLRKTQSVIYLLSRATGFSQELAVILYYEYHHIDSVACDVNNLKPFKKWIEHNIELYNGQKKCDEHLRCLSDDNAVERRKWEGRRQTMLNFHREALGEPYAGHLERVQGILKTADLKTTINKQTVFCGVGRTGSQTQNRRKRVAKVQDSVQGRAWKSGENVAKIQKDATIPLAVEIQNPVLSPRSHASLPPELQLIFGGSSFQIPTPPSTSATLSPIGSSPASGHYPASVNSTPPLVPLVQPIFSKPLRQTNLIPELKHGSPNEKSTHFFQEEAELKKIDDDLEKDETKLAGLEKSEQEFLSRIEALKQNLEIVRATKRALHEKMEEKRECKRRKEEKLRRENVEVNSRSDSLQVLNSLSQFGDVTSLLASLGSLSQHADSPVTWPSMSGTPVLSNCNNLLDATSSPAVFTLPIASSNLPLPGIFPTMASNPTGLVNLPSVVPMVSSLDSSVVGNSSLLYPALSSADYSALLALATQSASLST